MSEQAENMEVTLPSVEPATKPRWVWLAALLGLLTGPLAQVYVGRFQRAVILWIGGHLLSCFSAFALVTFQIPHILALFIIAWMLYRLFIVVDACLIARRDRNVTLKRYQRWWVYILLYIMLQVANYATAYTCRAFVGEAFMMPSRSMEPAIQAGERILVDKFWTNPDRIKRNDLVVFQPNLPDSAPFVMRVVGLPGETIEIKGERVFINGEPFEDSHAVFSGPERKVPIAFWNYGPEKIPQDSFFVLGDNRRCSRDSRFLGSIPFSNYIGTARIIYWSQKRIFPDPNDPTEFWLGPIQWERIGSRLD